MLYSSSEMYFARLMRNPIRGYAWGSRTVLAELRGEATPSARTEAELWMGAHPVAPSQVCVDDHWISLSEWIQSDPVAVLGSDVVRRFGPELPFLLKVLAVERPLSLQTHPNALQAHSGFARENERGVPIDAPERIYRDANPKPELICALTPFVALCGFRPIDDFIAQVHELRAPRLNGLLGSLRLERDPENLRRFYEALMRLETQERISTIGEVVEAAASGYGEPAVRGWLRKLGEAYPDDLGVLAPLFLNLLELRPGEALFLPAGELHAYLCGTAVEVMANSDNVIRGGLTQKHTDVAALIETLTFDSNLPEVRTPCETGTLARRYETPAREFELSLLALGPGRGFVSADPRSIEILFCYAGEAVLTGEGGVPPLALARGDAAVVPAAAGAYTLTGNATLYRATVPPG